MALSDVDFWVGLGITLLTNAVTVTYFITQVKDKVDYQGKEVITLAETTDEMSADTRRDIKEVAERITKLLITIEGFTREQSVLNAMNAKLVDSLTMKIENLSRIANDHAASLQLLNQLLRAKGLLE